LCYLCGVRNNVLRSPVINHTKVGKITMLKRERILVVGGGGREHAIIKKLSESKRNPKLFCAPGNAGIAQIATCMPIKATDIQGILNAVKEKDISLVFVAPDDPLTLGLVDELEKAGIRAFGPKKNAAIIEGSKAFSKELMRKYAIPTADYEVFENAEDAILYIKNTNKFPCVIKADGLALGKGVIIAQDFDEAQKAITEIMTDKIFGDSGNRVVIEEFLRGPEVSVLAFTDGKTVVPMVSAQDHKRAYDDDKGPNTGGMGTFSPSRVYDEKTAELCFQTIFQPTIAAMAKEGRPFKGVIYFGLMLCEEKPKVIEYNARFGDPEAQVVLPRLVSDLCDIIDAVIEERLDKIQIEWDNNTVVCVIAASGGYPGKYVTGYEISGLSEAEKSGAVLYHAGTKTDGEKIVTAGGRVLGVTCLGETMEKAREKAYCSIEKIQFDGMFYRRDIGIKKG